MSPVLLKPPRKLGLDALHQFGVHETVVVFYTKHGHLLTFQRAGKVALQLSLMHAFHADDHIRPFDEIGRKRCFGVMIGPGGQRLYALDLGKYGFGRRAAPLVLAADK